jgi:hypothetical protein
MRLWCAMSKRANITKCYDFPVEIAVPSGDLRSGLKRFSHQLRVRGLRVVKAFAEPGRGAHMLTICGPERALKAFLADEASDDAGLRLMLFSEIYDRASTIGFGR